MPHLKRLSSGHLARRADGHLATTCGAPLKTVFVTDFSCASPFVCGSETDRMTGPGIGGFTSTCLYGVQAEGDEGTAVTLATSHIYQLPTSVTISGILGRFTAGSVLCCDRGDGSGIGHHINAINFDGTFSIDWTTVVSDGCRFCCFATIPLREDQHNNFDIHPNTDCDPEEILSQGSGSWVLEMFFVWNNVGDEDNPAPCGRFFARIYDYASGLIAFLGENWLAAPTVTLSSNLGTPGCDQDTTWIGYELDEEEVVESCEPIPWNNVAVIATGGQITFGVVSDE